jgi:hypothetical protein
MERSRIQELHYLTDMANVAFILERGILSNRLARRVVRHVSVADAEVQARRAGKRVWVGLVTPAARLRQPLRPCT